MGERSDEIKREIDERREALGEKLEALETRVRGAANWRAQVEHRPVLAVALAFGGGLLASAILPKPKR